MIWIVFAILIGVTAIIWGGYTLYNNNTDNEGTQALTPTAVEPVPQTGPDTTATLIADTTTVASNPAPAANNQNTSTGHINLYSG